MLQIVFGRFRNNVFNNILKPKVTIFLWISLEFLLNLSSDGWMLKAN